MVNNSWMKIYTYRIGDNPPRTIGVDTAGHFLVEASKNLTILKEPKDYFVLLTVLETDRGQFDSMLRNKIDIEKIYKLKRDLFICGLTVSAYWSEMVINWIDIKDINEELKPLLKSAMANTDIDQKLRHRVRMLIKE